MRSLEYVNVTVKQQTPARLDTHAGLEVLPEGKADRRPQRPQPHGHRRRPRQLGTLTAS